ITLNDTYSFGSLTFNSTGAVTIAEANATQLSGSNTAGSLVLISTGAITDAAGITLSVTNNASFTADNAGTAQAITLGNDDTINFGSLTFDGAAVTIAEDSAMVLRGTSNASSLNLDAAGAISDDNTANVTVSGNADF